MGQMTTPKQLFEHELQDVYYAEKTIARMLPKLADEASSSELTRAFNRHLAETKEQIKNLEKVFSEIGKPAKAATCPGIEGIKQEHDKFMHEEQAATDIKDMFLTGAAARTEHYEIAAYNGLISMARALGERSSVKLLNENLRQEKEALKKVETISKQLLEKSQGNGRRSRSARSRTISARPKARTAARATTARRRTSR